MKAIANGKFLGESPASGGRRSFHYKLASSQSTYLLFVAVGDYGVVTENWKGKPVEYWVPRGREAEAKVTFGRTPKMLDFFSERLGAPYPYEKYAQVVCYDFVAGAVGNASVTSCAGGLLHDARHHPDSGADSAIAHELAHQWVGDLLTGDGWGGLGV